MIDTIVMNLYGINATTKTDFIKQSEYYKQRNLAFPLLENQMLYLKMLEYKGSSFKMNRVFNTQTKEFSYLSPEEYLNNVYAKEYITLNDYMEFVDGDSIKSIPMSKRGKIDLLPSEKEVNFSYAKGQVRTPSSISYVRFVLNPNAGFIQFEFSIPKYLYGNSLAQFIPQANSVYMQEYSIMDLKSFAFQRDILYPRLRKFIHRFFEDLCHKFELEAMPNLNYLEIRRLDFCYNQFHKDKATALNALSHMKKRTKKRARKNSRVINSREFANTLEYRTADGSYFKIYHKGTEFSSTKGDLKKMLKINDAYIEFLAEKESRETLLKFTEKFKVDFKTALSLCKKLFTDYGLGKPTTVDEENLDKIKPLARKIRDKLPYDVVFLKNEMDRVLRYEISLSTPFFSRIYKTKLFRRKDLTHQNFVRMYKRCKTVFDSRTRQNENRLLQHELRIYKEINAYYGRRVALLFGNEESSLKYLRIFEQKSYSYFHSDYDHINPNRRFHYKIGRMPLKVETPLNGADLGLFSAEMLKYCVNYFNEMRKQFHIEHTQPLNSFKEKIDHYNKQAKENLASFNSVTYDASLGWFGKNYVKGGRAINKRSDLLTDKQKRENHLQRINPLPLLGILEHMEKGKTMQQYFERHKINSSTRYRMREQLKVFSIYEKSIYTEEPIHLEYDFFTYYNNLNSWKYQQKFYKKLEYATYD